MRLEVLVGVDELDEGIGRVGCLSRRVEEDRGRTRSSIMDEECRRRAGRIQYIKCQPLMQRIVR